ncbi:MAG: tRNA (adenosine(37)-N6)-dimethylallyltransferase MiaA [Bacteroidales bacterium]
MDKGRYDIIVITGPTASGKTAFAALLASEYGGEIISADSRQVYRGMDTGTGKDYEDYLVDGRMVPVHMIDIVDPGYKYNVYEYQRDFLRVYENLRQKGVLPVVCGGSGMYIDSIISGYSLVKVPLNDRLRKELGNKSLEELSAMLAGYKRLHNKTDIDTHKRALRAIEIEEYYRHNSKAVHDFPLIRPLIFGIKYDRESRRERISRRLESRLESGMTEEVKALLDSGIPADTLIYYGLEYRYITYYLLGQMSYGEMKGKLETAIHQFAKRQMTWFRGMERKGIKIHWLDGHMSNPEKLKRVKQIMM